MRSIWVSKYSCSKYNDPIFRKSPFRKYFRHKEYLVTNDDKKCILHCQKDDWYEVEDNNRKSWKKSKDKILFFWKILDKYLRRSKENCYLENIIFPIFYIETNFTYKHVIKKNITILNCRFLDGMKFQHTTFEGNLTLLSLNSKDEFVFDYCNFNKEVYCELNHKEITSFEAKNIDLTFENCKFNENFLMYELDFSDCSLSFENTMFNNLVDFHNTTFGNVNFTNTRFNDFAVFTDCIFHKPLNLRNTIFKGEANFLDIKFTQLSNQETSRLIKHQFEKLNNKIEANKYHALEMEQHRRNNFESLKNSFLFDKEISFENILNSTISCFHWLSSNHSSNWVYPLLWIFAISFITTWSLGFEITINNSFKYINILSKIEDFNSSYIAMTLNKVSLGYLYYQFLTAVRKDTRK